MADEQAEKPKTTRGIAAILPPHAQEEMREANRQLGMALEVVRGIVDAAVADALPPGKVTELVVRKRREDDEAALARRRTLPTAGEVYGILSPSHPLNGGPGFDGEGKPLTAEEAPSAQVVDLMGALKAGLAAGKGGAS